MEVYGLSPTGSRFFEIVGKVVEVEKDEFLLECTDPLLLEVPVEAGDLPPGEKGITQAYQALEAQPVDSTMKVELKDLERLKRSKKVADARIHLLAGKAGKVVLGRSSDCDVVLDVGGVSRQHAEIHKAAGRWLLTDLGSNNGTFVNGKRIGANSPVALENQNSVWFATYRAVFLYPEGLYDLAAKLKKKRR